MKILAYFLGPNGLPRAVRVIKTFKPGPPPPPIPAVHVLKVLRSGSTVTLLLDRAPLDTASSSIVYFVSVSASDGTSIRTAALRRAASSHPALTSRTSPS